MLYHITVLPQKQNIDAAAGECLLAALLRGGFVVDAPCGGKGSCGKCRVLIDGKEALACRTVVDRDMTVTLPTEEAVRILTEGIPQPIAASCKESVCLAVDIGTTTVAGYLLDGKTGQELACGSMRNPQVAFGADVVTRIQQALHGHMEELTASIRKCVEELTRSLCEQAHVTYDKVAWICIVGNPAMEQLFLGICPENLAKIPFAPVLTQAQTLAAKAYLPLFDNAMLLIAPNISGFVGGDTVAGILAAGMDTKEELALLVDIGTNGEMVLGNKHRLVACSTAAGPALEGANIQFGMRGQTGAIDHVRWENGQLHCSVIGGGEAVGICGSGIVDAVAAALDAGWLNARGKILTEDSCIPLTETVYLTQEDIRQVQLAKGAIAAGIELMAAHMGVTLEEIQKVFLAGTFGTFMDPGAACRMGLLPSALEARITAVGNAAGSGAKLLARHGQALALTQALVKQVEFIELAALPEFPRCFARNMRF